MVHPVIYKFTHKEYLDGLLSGRSIKAGTLRDFRGTDNPGSRYFAENTEAMGSGRRIENPLDTLIPRGGIDDALEGRTLVHIDRLSSASEADRARAQVTKDALGIDMLGGFAGPGLSVSDTIVQLEVPNYFIYCCSNDLSETTVARIQADSLAFSGRPYDVAVPIVDVNGFANALTIAVCRKLGWFGSMRNIGGPVEYRANIFSVGDGSAELPHPMVKHPFFAEQNEFRIVIDRQVEKSQAGFFVEFEGDTSRLFGEPVSL